MTRAHAAECQHVLAECPRSPDSPLTVRERRERLAVDVVALEKGDLDADGSAREGSTAVLRDLLLSPAVVLQQLCDPWEVAEPDGEIDIAVPSRERARMEIDCPTAEQPVLDAFGLEAPVQIRHSGQLLTV